MRLGDQGQQYDASSVRPAAKLRKLEQGEVPTLSAQELLLVSGTVTYDDGTMFRLTSANAQLCLWAQRWHQRQRCRQIWH